MFNNSLLFHSDLFSLFVFMEAFNLLFWMPLAVIYAPIHLVLRKLDEKLTHVLGVVAAAVFICVAGMVLYNDFESLRAVLLIFCSSVLLISCVIFFLPAGREISRRTTHMSVVLLLGLVCVFVCSVVWIKTSRLVGSAGAQQAKRHVVFLMVDAMTATHMKTFNDSASEKHIDRLAQDALIFPGMRTNAVWTYGYHAALFSGRKDIVFEEATSMLEGRDNIYSALQDAGVKTRWITFHSNGVPETNGLSEYGGIRSNYITENWSWLPNLLGLDYHVFMYNNSGNRKSLSKAKAQVLDALNGVFPETRLFPDYVLKELSRVQKNSDRSFLYAHLCSGMFGVDTWSVPESREDDQERLKYFADSRDFRVQGKVYTPEDESAVELEREYFEHDVAKFGEQLDEFFQGLSDAGMDDTMVIVTSDHGFATSNYRYGYQYNWEEETVNVPFMVFNSGETGVDDRNLETVDITESILDHFGVGGTLNEDAVSIFGSESKEYTTSVTLPCDYRKEWMLLVYRDGYKYGVNIHPDGNADVFRGRVDGLEVADVEHDARFREEIEEEINAALQSYAISAKVRKQSTVQEE